MKLYEVNHQLKDLLIQPEPDQETGEIPTNEEEIIAQIHALALKREDIPSPRGSIWTPTAVQFILTNEQ